MAAFKKIREATTTLNNNIIAYSNHHKAEYINNDYVYLLAGTHGDEPESTYVLNKLIQEDFFKSLSYKIIFIPEVNPDGLKSNTRVNSHGVDLNRNLPTPNWIDTCEDKRYFPGAKPNSEIETNFLIETFKKYTPRFIISFHSWKPILNHNKNPQAESLSKLISQYNQYLVASDIGYDTPGSLGEYVDYALGCGIITYELPVVSSTDDTLLTMEDIWNQNKPALKAALNFLRPTSD